MSIFGKKKLRGRDILEMEKNGSLNESTTRILQILRSDGVTDTDIENWWNLSDKEHKNIKKDDQIAILGFTKSLIDQGYEQDDKLERKIRENFPIFEDYTPDTEVTETGLLPYELKIRIMNFFNNQSQKDMMNLKVESYGFPTMNAFIRFLVKQNRL